MKNKTKIILAVVAVDAVYPDDEDWDSWVDAMMVPSYATEISSLLSLTVRPSMIAIDALRYE